MAAPVIYEGVAYQSCGPLPGLLRNTRRRLAFGLTFAITILASATSLAQPSVHWIAPAECPQDRDFVAALREQLAEPGALEQVTTVDANIGRTGKHGYTLRLGLTAKGRSARRTLAADACGELLSAAVWLIVLALGPSGLPQAPERNPDTDVEEEPRGAASTAKAPAEAGDSPVQRAAPDQQTAAQKGDHRGADARRDQAHKERETSAGGRERNTPREVHARVAGFGGLFAGAGAKAQGAVGIWGDVSVGALHTQVVLADVLPIAERVTGGGHVQVWSLAFGLSECALWGKRAFAGPCLGVEGLRTAAHSKDFGRDLNRSVLWAAVDAGLQVLWPLTTSLELNLAGSVAMPVTPRPRFTVAGVGVVAAAERVFGEAHLGLIYRAL